ncbi:hypothetical protein CONLIGDRAFT_678054 [Coniochaeta ligniaria NRRL 30616]|uniref:C3H1-type domain-containing protein n=1 Tax=Coniochaeta ligniaria NRRL 30616 TaxID=1408157 RepID=A0A1J7JNW5_9PEZI|nr:hypothetical protein CONLIGDRAFT_678054 [Coniochaeta ligniaria NRRL 30616]
MSSPTSPQVNTSPTDAGTSQGSNDPGNNNNTGPGGRSDTQVSKALTQTTQQQQGGGRGAGQTDMPYYAYCYDRGNGQYTRLVPVDMLPPLVDIPALQHGCLGMTVLPCPTGLAPNGRSSNLERVFVQPVQQFPGGQMRTGNMRDPVQSRIDTIIASSPAPEAQKKLKIYCDKWIHEGVCAFTQQGCKYKHEMPLDKDTQESLGLFQGLPIWWRKHQGEITSDQQAHVMDSPPTAPAGRARAITNTGRGGFGGANRLRHNTWRSQGHGQGRGPSGSVSSASGAPVVAGSGQLAGHGRQQQQVAQFSSPFGPIAPPSASTRREFEATANTSRNPFVDNNPWNVLKADHGSDDSEDGAKLG